MNGDALALCTLSAGLLRPGSFFKGDGALVKKDCRRLTRGVLWG